MATATVKPAEDLFTLANRLRDKGLDDDRLVDALTGLGFTKAQARDAAASTAPPAVAEPVATEAPEAILPASGTAAEGGAADSAGARSRTPRRGAPRGSGKASKAGLGSSLGKVQRGVDKGLSEAGSLTLTPPKRITVKAASGFAGGLLLYVLALNYLRYGPDGVKGWFAAKFVNRPITLGDPDDIGKGIGEGLRLGRARDDDQGLTSTRPRRPQEV